MKRIVVLGPPGSGKSTFARALSKMTGIPCHHLDLIWHKPDRTNITREEFDTALDGIMANDKWIIDGNYSRTIPKRLEKCDTVFLLDYPIEICLESARARIGTKREDLPFVEYELDPEFSEQIKAYPTEKMPTIRRLVSECHGKEIHIFVSRAEADVFLNMG